MIATVGAGSSSGNPILFDKKAKESGQVCEREIVAKY